jgi:hypothetical protein
MDRTEVLKIRMSPEELGYIKKVAELLNTPVSTLARQELMRIFGPTREDGVFYTADGERVYRKEHPVAKKEKVIARIDAQRMMRSELKQMKERLEEMEVELAIREC